MDHSFASVSLVALSLCFSACSREVERPGDGPARVASSASSAPAASAPAVASNAPPAASSERPASSATAPVASAAPAGPAELAIVKPLHDGLEVEGWKVDGVGAVDGGTMRVTMVRDESRVVLEIALDDEHAPTPPARAGRYAIYYSAHHTTPDDASRLARWLAKILEKNRAAPAPRDLGHFAPTPKPERAL